MKPRFFDVYFNAVVSLTGKQAWIEMPVFRLDGPGIHMSVQEYYLETIGLDGENYEDFRQDFQSQN